MAQLYDQLAAQNPDGQFYRLDIEEVREVPQALGVRNVSLAAEDHERGTDHGTRSATRV